MEQGGVDEEADISGEWHYYSVGGDSCVGCD